jgi:cation transport protein ChaC
VSLPPAPAAQSVLTREWLLSGELETTLRAMHPDMHVLTAAERAESLDAVMAQRPEHGQGLWVFAYGSLIWNPTMHITERRLARVDGWHRSFCLATRSGRGTAETPGMLLGLEAGGQCEGAVLRVAEEHLAQELDILWRREMVADGYIPRWLDVCDPNDEVFGAAIAFTINPQGPNYVGDLAEPELIRRLAYAHGRLGSGADYLFNTRDGLRHMGINDALLEHLGAAVEAEHGVT